MNKKIILASNNKGKIKELSDILAPIGYEVISQREAGIDIEVEETGSSFSENAGLKAKAVYERCKAPVIAEDSDRCAKLLNELEGISEKDRGAQFVCVICYIDESGAEHYIRGECRGKIGYIPLGENGFGYDPVFIYGDKSFAQISADEKNKISHRAKAVEGLCRLLNGKD